MNNRMELFEVFEANGAYVTNRLLVLRALTKVELNRKVLASK